MTKAVQAILEAYHYRTLQTIAEEAGLNADRPKADLITVMASTLFAKERVLSVLETLDERERAVIAYVLRYGGEVPTERLHHDLMRAGVVVDKPPSEEAYGRRHSSEAPYAGGAYVGRASRSDSGVLQDIVAGLTLRGLLFSRNPGLNTAGNPYKLRLHPGRTLVIPEPIRSLLPSPDPVAPPLGDWEPDDVVVGTPDHLLRDLYLYWDSVRRSEVAFIQAGYVGKRALKAINDQLLVSDPSLEDARWEDETERLYLLRQMLQRLGLIRRVGDCLQPTGEGPLEIPGFWCQEQAEMVRACVGVWADTAGGAGLDKEVDHFEPRYSWARGIVLRVMASFEPGIWIEPEDVVVAVRSEDPDFLFLDRQDIETLSRRQYHRAYAQAIEKRLALYERAEFQFVVRCLTGFFHQTGLLELGYERGEFRAFRLTPAGSAILGGRPVPPEDQRAEPGGKLVVQPTFAVMAMGPLALDTLARLDLFAQRERADRAVFEYRLSRESLYAAQQLGLTVPQVIRFLETKSDTGVPQNVRRSLEAWGTYLERFVFRTDVSLLESADAAALEQLMDDAKTGRCLARAAAPTVALIKDQQQSELVAELLRQGRPPALSDGRFSSADDSVVVDPDGMIHAIYPVSSLHLHVRLARIAEQRGNGVWALTPQAIRRAGGSANRVLSLLAELQRLHRGSLPGEVVHRVKAEGGYYGKARAETLTLLEFRDVDTLEELREDPELALLLTPFPAGGRALAVAPAESLEQLRDALDMYGVSVEEGLA